MERIHVVAGLVTGTKLVEAILSPQTIDAAEMCRVGQNIKAVTFKDRFPETGQGRPHIYDGPVVDQEVGPATGFVVYAITKDGKSLGQVAVGPTGQAKILNIEQPCNAKGPNGKPALEWTYYTEQNPSHKVAAIAENGFAANTVIGRELKQDPRPTETKVATATTVPTITPTRTPTVTSTAVATYGPPFNPELISTPTATPVPGTLDANYAGGLFDALRNTWPSLAIGVVLGVLGAAAIRSREQIKVGFKRGVAAARARVGR